MLTYSPKSAQLWFKFQTWRNVYQCRNLAWKQLALFYPRAEVYGSMYPPSKTFLVPLILLKLCKKFIISHHVSAVSFHTSPLILLMHSCEIVITPHNGTTDDLLCLSAVFLDLLQHCDILWSFASLWLFNAETSPVLDVLLLCVDPFVEEWPRCERWGFPADSCCSQIVSAEFLPCSTLWTREGNGASNLVSVLPIKL